MLVGMSSTRMATDGARKLREYLDRTPGLTIHGFCEQHDLDYGQVHRLLSGDRGRRVSVDIAEAIEQATDGAVPWRSWHSRTLRPTSSRRKAA